MTKTPQVKPGWNTGIYIGEGVVAQPTLTKWYVCQDCGYDRECNYAPNYCPDCGSLHFELEIEEDGR